MKSRARLFYNLKKLFLRFFNDFELGNKIVSQENQNGS
jgi:hypothetical protein